MINNNVSFGAKIPVASCQVYDIARFKHVPATIYEYDCKDSLDFYEVAGDRKRWMFKDSFANLMKEKFTGSKFMTTTNFYTLEKGLAGIMMCHKIKNQMIVSTIETTKNCDYKFAGKNLLCAAAKVAMKEGRDDLVISSPVPSAIDFYTKSCGFKPMDEGNVAMKKVDMEGFIERTQAQTKAQIVDLIG